MKLIDCDGRTTPRRSSATQPRDYLWNLARAPQRDEARHRSGAGKRVRRHTSRADAADARGAAVTPPSVARPRAGALSQLRRRSLVQSQIMSESIVQRTIVPVCLILMLAAGSASAQTPAPGPFGITVEGLNVWQQRNDVRIPADTGTEFSLVELLGSSPTPSVRVTATADVTERQQVRIVYAPLRLAGRGTLEGPVAFAGTTFAPAPTDAVYRFTSYRATWSYSVYRGPTWTWRIGFTGFVRDARVALTQGDRTAEDTDVGFVPLGHVSAEARLSTRWSAGLVLDASAAPQGRAIDFAATLEYRPTPRWTVFGGYRTIEGGADVDAVYAFAWLNAVVGGIGVRF